MMNDPEVSRRKDIDYSTLSKLFHLPLNKAAEVLKIGRTTLKQRCRELQIHRWPYSRRYNRDSTPSPSPVLTPVKPLSPTPSLPSSLPSKLAFRYRPPPDAGPISYSINSVPLSHVIPPTTTCNLGFGMNEKGAIEVGSSSEVSAYIRQVQYHTLYSYIGSCPFPHEPLRLKGQELC
ncbi:hypothetical protein RCL1_003508 [Eukaryota sp. TZLM3-RCL]